ncbi:uncharacterized protein DUF4270 [Aquimarina sp. MAR_2010_214]|uniref:DUF4270 domain-containing protein n=1 Tax=Aquimarina sp. MAR_2010_214 TaxID=1250026 RepID=UPI000CA657A5|nr:DUF4270 domain-containing protein [Aquimarina sp. MAR_2010_214]PKV48473.1 uncharacterized protein DUF4270 [Aquimarina sp. MAR_2010_214]
MKLKNILIRITAIVAVVFTFLSCDDDFDSVGSEVLGDVNFEDKQYSITPIAYSKKFERVRTNNLVADQQGAVHSNLLGVYDDPIYGQSVYGILSQVQLSKLNPSFGTNAVLDKVVLSLPYFSTATSTAPVQVGDATETATTYRLDSIYGNQPFKLSVYKSDYFLRDFDPESNERQVYYSNDIDPDIDPNSGFKPEVEKPENLLYTNNDFVPSADEIIVTTETVTDTGETTTKRERLAPRLRVELPDDIKALFSTWFIDKQGSVELSNANNFRNYFRGIYVKAEPINNNGNLIYLNTRDAKITLHYSFDETTNGNTIRKQDKLELNFGNTFINSITTKLDGTLSNGQPIAEELKKENQDTVNGEDNLYLKGGDGSYAIIDLFSGNVTNEKGEQENELSFLKRQNWLINDASIKFYINQNEVTGGDAEPERVFIFNAETGEVLLDYFLDGSINTDIPLVSAISHLGRISRDSDKNGEFYKIRMTQYILNIIKGELKNAKLGLSVSQNVNITTIIDNTPTNKDDSEIIPTSSIVSHEGTILYGNGAGVPESKRLKLNIFYTKSKEN